VKLPALLVLTDGAQAASVGHELFDVIVRAVQAGATGVVVRERHLAEAQRRALLDRVEELLDGVGGLLLAASPPLGDRGGVHLRAVEPVPSARPAVVGRSCHDPDEVAAAAEDGCDYATLSPIFATASKPGYGPALGTEALRGCPLPVYALGGVTAANAAACRAAGAAGVAVMGAVMRAPDPADPVARLLAAVEDRP